MRAKYTGLAAFLSCTVSNGTYVATTAFTIACPVTVTGFSSSTNNLRPNRLAFKSFFKRLGQQDRPFHDGAVSLITQLGAFSLQFRSRSGCVFVARWRSGLTIGVQSPSLSHLRARQLVYELVLQKKRNNFIWQRRDATPRGFCAFSMFMFIGEHVQGVLWMPVARLCILHTHNNCALPFVLFLRLVCRALFQSCYLLVDLIYFPWIDPYSFYLPIHYLSEISQYLCQPL